jgi:hypothetical protein
MTGPAEPVEVGDLRVFVDPGAAAELTHADILVELDGIAGLAVATDPIVEFVEQALGDLAVETACGEPEVFGGELGTTPDGIALDLAADDPGADRRVVRQFLPVHRALARLLTAAGLVAPDAIGSETPGDLQARMPYVRIVRVGGGSDLVNDYPQVDIDVFATTSRAGEDLAERIRQFLTLPAPAYTSGVLLDRIDCLTAATERPWADTRVRRYGATYRVVSRRQAALTTA